MDQLMLLATAEQERYARVWSLCNLCSVEMTGNKTSATTSRAPGLLPWRRRARGLSAWPQFWRWWPAVELSGCPHRPARWPGKRWHLQSCQMFPIATIFGATITKCQKKYHMKKRWNLTRLWEVQHGFCYSLMPCQPAVVGRSGPNVPNSSGSRIPVAPDYKILEWTHQESILGWEFWRTLILT